MADKLGDSAELVRQLWAVGGFAEVRGEYTAAAVSIDKLLEVARREGSAIAMAMAHAYQVELRLYRGDLVGSEEYFEQGLQYFETPEFAQVNVGISAAFVSGATIAWMRGRVDSARRFMRRVVEQAEQNPFERAYCRHTTALMHVYLREMDQAEAAAAKSLAEAVEHGFPDIANWAQLGLGIARAELGRPAEGVILLRKNVTGMKESGARLGITLALTSLAWAQALGRQDCRGARNCRRGSDRKSRREILAARNVSDSRRVAPETGRPPIGRSRFPRVPGTLQKNVCEDLSNSAQPHLSPA